MLIIGDKNKLPPYVLEAIHDVEKLNARCAGWVPASTNPPGLATPAEFGMVSRVWDHLAAKPMPDIPALVDRKRAFVVVTRVPKDAEAMLALAGFKAEVPGLSTWVFAEK